jgi:hypothetical protein
VAREEARPVPDGAVIVGAIEADLWDEVVEEAAAASVPLEQLLLDRLREYEDWIERRPARFADWYPLFNPPDRWYNPDQPILPDEYDEEANELIRARPDPSYPVRWVQPPHGEAFNGRYLRGALIWRHWRELPLYDDVEGRR